MDKPGSFQISVLTLVRLADPAEFSNIVVKTLPGSVVRLKDVANVELAAQDYSSNSYLDRDPAVGLAVFQRPGSNALATANAIQATMLPLSQRFPPGLKSATAYNPTQFIPESVNAVQDTILQAVLLVASVAIL